MTLMPEGTEQPLAKLHRELGLKRLNLWWAKAEIVIGLVATAFAVFAPEELINHWTLRAALFVLGMYFALAGHRSHLYQSTNKLVAHVVSKIER